MAPVPRRPSSSFRQPASWLVVVAGLAGYLGLVYALTRYRVTLTQPPLPWWALQAAPPLLYGLLIVLCLRRVTPGGFLGGTLTLWAAHILIGTLTPLLAAVFDPLNRGRILLLTFPPPPLPQVALVPLLLVPLRSVLAPKSPVRRVSRPSGVELRRASGSADRLAAPVLPSVPAPEAVSPPAPEATGWAGSRPAWPPVEEKAPALAQEAISPPADRGAEQPAVEVATEWEAPKSAPPPAPPEVAEDVVVRIPFSRIAAQFSTDTFLLPLDRVAASLPEPGVVVVPARYVLPQLSEGLVTVAWDIVADQFPRDVLAITDEEVKTGLRQGGLVLPLDEVVHQLPHELFAATGPGPDVRGLESYPAPFQPFEPEREADLAPANEPEPRVDAVLEAAPAMIEEPAIPPLAEPVPEPILEPPRFETIAPPAVGDEADVLRISFHRLATQLPRESFVLPLDRVSANLTEPGFLRIPRAVVLPQLGEGEVRVPWDIVVGQLPRQLLALSEEELARRFIDGLLLPLDEVVRQLPPETFAAAGPGPDVRQLESFPAPFQPLVPEAPAQVETTAGPVEEPAPVVEPEPISYVAAEPEPHMATEPELHIAAEPELQVATEPELHLAAEPEFHPAAELEAVVTPGTETEEEAPTLVLGDESLEPPRFDFEPLTEVEPPAEPIAFEPDEQPAPVLEIPDLEPEPALMEQLEAELASASEAPAEPELEAPAVETVPSPTEPIWAAPEATVRPEAFGTARRIAALMAPMASLGVEANMVNGESVFTLASPGVPDELALSAARLVLPLLAVGHAPWPVDQLTLRGPSAALVFTPLGPPEARGPMLVAAISQSGSLALLEILCRRAATAFTAAGDSGGGPAASGNGGGRPELVAIDLPARARQIASTLGALGPVTAAALRETAGKRALYLFLPSGADAREVGGFALEVGRAMAKATAEGAAFQVAVVRSGQRCLVIRPDTGSGDRPHTVVAAGETAKPGLAFRQVERAVAALGSA
jgi:hypothetical protein